MEQICFRSHLWTAFCCLIDQWWIMSLKVKAVTAKIQGSTPGSSCDCCAQGKDTTGSASQAPETSQDKPVSRALRWDRAYPECPLVPCSDLAKCTQPSNFRTLKYQLQGRFLKTIFLDSQIETVTAHQKANLAWNPPDFLSK